MFSIIKGINTLFRTLFLFFLLLLYAYFPDIVSLRSTYFHISLQKEILFYVLLSSEIVLYIIIKYCIYVIREKKMSFFFEGEKYFFSIWLYGFSIIIHICFITTALFLNILNNAEHLNVSNYGYIAVVSLALVVIWFLFLLYKIIRFATFRISS